MPVTDRHSTGKSVAACVCGKNSRAAFTLLELMLVLAILAVLAAMSMPQMSKTLAGYRLKKSADTLRGEWSRLRVQAMEEGKIYCLRCEIGGNRIMTDRILDVHFTATLVMEESLDSYTGDALPHSFEEGGFTGEEEDFILRDPAQVSEENGGTITVLPEKTFVADAIALPDERAAYYIGMASASRDTDDENTFESEAVANQDYRLGETSGSGGKTWSAPIFFFPDGTTSTAAVLLKNERNQCLEVRLRGLTATATLCEIVSEEQYDGDMDAATTWEQ